MIRAIRFSSLTAMQRKRTWWVAALALVVSSACATPLPLPLLPPLPGATGAPIPGKFVWIDLVAKNVAGARNFYGELFGWTFTEGAEYTQILNNGVPIAGIVPERQPDRRSEWIGNLSVVDLDASVEKVKQLGGKIQSGPLDAPDRGRIALARDPEGALFLLVQSSGGDPADGDLKVGAWFWREIWTHDIQQAKAFYSAIGGYEVEEVGGVEKAGVRDNPYAVFKAGGRLRAGVVQAPEDVNPLWLPYVRVEDPKGTAERAASLGARIVMQDERSAIMVDPDGAPFAVQLWTGSSDKSVEEAR